MRLCAWGSPEPRLSASPFRLLTLPLYPGAQGCSRCVGEAQYVSIELNCCGRRLYTAAEPGSARRYREEIYGLNGEAKSCSRPRKIKRGRYSHEVEVREEGRPSNHRRSGPCNAVEVGETQAHPGSLYSPPIPLCPQEQSPTLTQSPHMTRLGSKDADRSVLPMVVFSRNSSRLQGV